MPKPGFTGAPARVTRTVFDHKARACPERTAREDGELATTQKMRMVVLTCPRPAESSLQAPSPLTLSEELASCMESQPRVTKRGLWEGKLLPPPGQTFREMGDGTKGSAAQGSPGRDGMKLSVLSGGHMSSPPIPFPTLTAHFCFSLFIEGAVNRSLLGEKAFYSPKKVFKADVKGSIPVNHCQS